MTIVANPRNYKIPEWFLNRQRDYKTNKFLHVSARCAAGPPAGEQQQQQQHGVAARWWTWRARMASGAGA